jgi:3-hydroxyisobutyrate dehydrogenase-like beta-hydroxyacid dehydrogenase
MQRVAIIGLGVMGSGMAANWLAKGFAVTVYNRTRAKAQPLAAKGAMIAASPREAAEGADFVFAMVSDDAVSRQIWLGDEGALAGVKRGAIAVESSTLSPSWVRELAGLAEAKGADFLDAPVGGSRPAANEGKLVFFIGGEPGVLARARPALAAVGGRIHPVGGIAAGATWKLVNNVMGAAHLAILTEGLAMAAKSGIDLALVPELIAGSSPASPMVLGKLPRMLARQYDTPDFALRLMEKDVSYAEVLAKSLGMQASVITGVLELYRRAEAQGLGDGDVAGVREADA